jgi:Immunity protein Imm1
MIVELWDTQGRSSTAKITNQKEISDLLETFPERLPFFCEFTATNGYKLLVGIRGQLGCVQYSSTDNSPPYLVAVETDRQVPDEEVDFLMANTDTPVSARYCVQFAKVRDIILHFFETGQRSPAVPWEDI